MILANRKNKPYWKLDNPDEPDEQIQQDYRIWANIWILPDLLELLKNIPE